jgi:hypothetical protein
MRCSAQRPASAAAESRLLHAVVGGHVGALYRRTGPQCRVLGRIVALVHRHWRYGAEMIYLKPRQAGERVNHKRVEWSENLTTQKPYSPFRKPQACNKLWTS